MTAPTINGTRYPQPVDALLPAARNLDLPAGQTLPSRNRLMREFRIGAPKADDLLARLKAEREKRTRTEQTRTVMIARGALLPLDADLTDLALTDLAEPAPVPLDYAEPIGPNPAPPAPAETTERADTLRAAMTARGALLPPAGTSWTDPGVPESAPVAEPAPTPAPPALVAEAAEQVTVVGHPGPNITTAPAATRSAGRGWAYVGVILGGVVSIAANVAHTYLPKPPEGAPAGWTPAPDWSPSPLAVAFSVFWPVALFVAVEILTRIPWGEGLRWFMARIVGVLPVALVAAVVSYRHLAGLLEHFGEDPLTVAIGPLAIDGLMVMASAALLATNRHRNRT
ncbi:DUF2637 domain-containing protein [Micromonospora sp. WMMD737]|uniref:DUF2637 domain-containing protein n=1 Tax=Micromonospora sp. WMMD737 TaxID=3404113 RepID=UPI003B95FBEA